MTSWRSSISNASVFKMRFEVRVVVILLSFTCTIQQQTVQRHIAGKTEETDPTEKQVLPFGARIPYSAEDRSSLPVLPVPVADSARKVLPVTTVGREVVHPKRRKKLRKVKVPKRRTGTPQTVSKDTPFNNTRAVVYRMPAELRNSDRERISLSLREFNDSKRHDNDKHITSVGQIVNVGTVVSSVERRHKIEKLENGQQQQTANRYAKDKIIHRDVYDSRRMTNAKMMVDLQRSNGTTARKRMQEMLLNKNVALKPAKEDYNSRLSVNKLNHTRENVMENTRNFTTTHVSFIASHNIDPSAKMIGRDISSRTSIAKNLTKIFNYNHPFKAGEKKNASTVRSLNSVPGSFNSSLRKENFEKSIRNNFDNLRRTVSGPSIPISSNFQFPSGIIPLKIDFHKNFSTVNNAPQFHLLRNNVSVSYFFYNSSTDGDNFNDIYKPSIIRHEIPEIDNLFRNSTNLTTIHRNSAINNHKLVHVLNPDKKVGSRRDSGSNTGRNPTTNSQQTSSKPVVLSTNPATVPAKNTHNLSPEERVVSSLRSQQNRDSGPHPEIRTPPCRCSWSMAECGCSCGNTSLDYDDFQFLAKKTFRPCDSFSFEISGDQYALPPNFFSGIGRVKDFTLRLSNASFQYLFDPTPGSSPFRGVSFQRRGLIRITGVNVVRGWNWVALDQLTSTSGSGVDVEIDRCGLSKLSSDFARVAGGDVTNLRISDSEMEMIGSGSFATFNAINRLLLPQNRLRELRRDDLPPEPRQLKEIDLRENQLKSLEPDLFSGMESLSSISLEGNPLMILDERTFDRVIGRTHVLGLSKIPLLCDCSLRWLKNSTMDSNPVLERNIRGATCRRPPHLRGTPFRDLSVEHLTCSKSQGH